MLFGLLIGPLQWRRTHTLHESASLERERQQFVDVTEQLGMSRDALRSELAQGKSMMDIAKEHGIQLRMPPPWMRDDDRQEFVQRIAERMGMSPEQLREELSHGKKLMDIAQERGIPLKFPVSREYDDLPE